MSRALARTPTSHGEDRQHTEQHHHFFSMLQRFLSQGIPNRSTTLPYGLHRAALGLNYSCAKAGKVGSRHAVSQPRCAGFAWNMFT